MRGIKERLYFSSVGMASSGSLRVDSGLSDWVKLGTRPLVLGSTGPKQRGKDKSRMRPYRAAATIRFLAALGHCSACCRRRWLTYRRFNNSNTAAKWCTWRQVAEHAFRPRSMLFCLE